MCCCETPAIAFFDENKQEVPYGTWKTGGAIAYEIVGVELESNSFGSEIVFIVRERDDAST